MKLRFEGNVTSLRPGIQALSQEIAFTEDEAGLPVQVELSAGDLEIGLNEGGAYIRFARKHQFFRGLGLLVQYGRNGRPFTIRETEQFDTIGPMFDLSRNGVLTLDSFKFLLRKMALMGLNTVMLYLEDTYEISGEPYFGYMRGVIRRMSSGKSMIMRINLE